MGSPTLPFSQPPYQPISCADAPRDVTNPDERPSGDGILPGLVSLSASHRFTKHWAARVTWNRVVNAL
ncbi:hypothetical protein [Paraburkholderia franconis]|uniref:hypothetical protein n=1 Tax=Paraburkholderia franconis TaxID=2654983 RepID=UPI00187B6A5B|nr:hypothetical protein [Paraburkholderia franconis]